MFFDAYTTSANPRTDREQQQVEFKVKKKMALSLLALVVVFASFALGAYAAVKYSLSVNGKQVKTEVKVINGATYIPLSALSGLENITIQRDAKKARSRSRIRSMNPISSRRSRNGRPCAEQSGSRRQSRNLQSGRLFR